MSLTMRRALAGLTVCLMFGSSVAAQAPQQPAQGQLLPPVSPQQLSGVPQQQQPTAPAQAPFVPDGFALNTIQQTYLDSVLDAWQVESAKVNTFKCDFERHEFNAAFGPGQNIPLNIDKGELSFQKPDKGSFQITEMSTWKAEPAPPAVPGQPPAPAQGNWVKQPKEVGEHWVCDGKSVYEYRHDQEQVVERPIPVELQGQAIVDGPLPFLFGAESAKLKQRYWMRVEQQSNPNEIWITARPKAQADAANFQAVQVVLDRTQMLPKAMQVKLPDNSIHRYLFDLPNATINSPLARLQSLFQRPRVPKGWKRVVEQVPVQQAAQPVEPPR